MTKLTLENLIKIPKEELSEYLEFKKMLKLGPNIDDPTKWSIWGGNCGDKPNYLEVVDRKSFDNLRSIIEPMMTFMNLHKQYLRESGTAGAFGVFIKARFGEM